MYFPACVHRVWFWVKQPTGDQSSLFDWARDNVYGGAILLGVGNATMMVIAYTMISNLVGKYTVSVIIIYVPLAGYIQYKYCVLYMHQAMWIATKIQKFSSFSDGREAVPLSMDG